MGEVWTIWVKRVLRKRKAGGKALRQGHVWYLEEQKTGQLCLCGKMTGNKIREKMGMGWVQIMYDCIGKCKDFSFDSE